MKKQIKISTIIAIGACLLLTINSFGQSFYDWLEKIGKKANNDRMHIVMEIESTDAENQLLFEGTTEIKKNGLQYYYKYGDLEMLINSKVLIFIQHAQKQVSVQRVEDPSQLQGIQMASFDLDSMMSLYKHPYLIGENNTSVTYGVSQVSGLIDSTEITFDKQKAIVSHLVYKQRSPYNDDFQRVSITFEQFDYAPLFTDADFDHRRFITFQGEEVILSEYLKGYKIFKR